MNELQARQIIISGRVQGVGFRPFVYRLAAAHNLAGWVRNRDGLVEIWAEGSARSIAAFTDALRKQAPPLARPDVPRVSPVSPAGLTEFSIKRSAVGLGRDVHIPPDYFVCDDCLAEMQDVGERRYRYPFINCTQCGPRYTLIDRLPYDRPNTAMAGFVLCRDCRNEYDDPMDRRYHAQPLACPRCGPGLTFNQPGQHDICDNERALKACLDALRHGSIVAVKGVGGYHLLCDAADSAAVDRLRQRKLRPDKPLAVLVPWCGDDGLEWVRRLADLSEPERRLISSPQRPIVLLRKLERSALCEAVAPALNEVGLMLPYSPLHHLLADGYGKPLVATSANLSGEPVLTDNDEVASRLSEVADAFLHHDRPIRRPADDSVYRSIAGKTRPLRLGRGIAPLERQLPFRLGQPLLALGADLKNTVALAFDDRVAISPHIGNLGSVRSERVFEQVIADFTRLYGVAPRAIVCDAHPAYYSTLWAKRREAQIVAVFHHHAHASALAGEHELTGDMLVFTWDGTGYGPDGTIWGGEALLGSPGHWRRVASLRPFRLPGGDKASREPWRCALSVCWEQGLTWTDCPQDSALLRQVWEQGINSPVTSSAGRLFDAAAALVGVAQFSSYEGHAAMRLEGIAHAGAKPVALPLSAMSNGLLISDWAPLLPVLSNRQIDRGERASLFHASLGQAIVDQALALRDIYGVGRIGLTGGVFQNRLLTEQVLSGLKRQNFKVYLHEELPSGDGGICFGQIVEAAFAGSGFNTTN